MIRIFFLPYLGNRSKSDPCSYEIFCLESHILSFPKVLQIPPESPCIYVQLIAHFFDSHVLLFMAETYWRVSDVCDNKKQCIWVKINILFTFTCCTEDVQYQKQNRATISNIIFYGYRLRLPRSKAVGA